MSNPLFYILAPFGLAFALFAVFLIVSIFLKDPARPFRMFAAPPLKGKEQEPSDFAEASTDKESRSQEPGEDQEQEKSE
jgi:hypothetical protein